MNINHMTDEQLAAEIRIIGETNNVVHLHGGIQMWIAIAKFIRQCVADSQPEGLTVKEIKNVIDDWLSCGESRLSPDDVIEIAHAIYEAMEKKEGR